MKTSTAVTRFITARRAIQTVLLGATLATTLVSAQTAPPASGEPPAKTPSYFIASQVDWIPLLPTPPAAGSAEQQRDLQGVLDAQAAARQNPQRRQQAIDDSELSCFRFADVLGKAFDEKRLPKTAEFLKKATDDGLSAGNVVKEHWQRPRPYVNNPQVEKLADMDPEYVKQKEAERKARAEQERKEKAARDAAAGKQASAPPPPPANAKPVNPEEEKKKEAEKQKEKDNTSFPSGHALEGSLCGILLSQMLPEKQAELYARAASFRDARLIVGAHHRTDVEASAALATAVAAVMSQNFAFQRDLNEARRELRPALGLPVDLPVRKKDKKDKDEKQE